MKLSGKLVRGTNIIKDLYVENKDSSLSFNDRLENSLVDLCKKLDISVPVWLSKNTDEFVRFRRIYFLKEQFVEDVGFDVFEVRFVE